MDENFTRSNGSSNACKEKRLVINCQCDAYRKGEMKNKFFFHKPLPHHLMYQGEPLVKRQPFTHET